MISIKSGYAALNFSLDSSKRIIHCDDDAKGISKLKIYKRNDLKLAKAIGERFKGQDDVVIFSLNCFPYHGMPDEEYYQIEPIWEYYTWSPVLCFRSENLLVKDLRYFEEITDNKVRPYIVVKKSVEKETLEKLFYPDKYSIHVADEIIEEYEQN